MNKVQGLFLVAIFSIVYTQLVNSQSLRGCQNKCGNLSVEYPFGISTGCYYPGQNNFNLTCDETTNKLFTGNFQVINISHNGELRILESRSYTCYNATSETGRSSFETTLVNFTLSSKNRITAVGCNTYAFMTTTYGDRNYSTGCLSICDSIPKENGLCSGEGCCHTPVPKGSERFIISSSIFARQASVYNFNPCSFAFLVEEGMFSFSPAQDLSNLRNVTGFPIVLDWSIGEQTCQQVGNTSMCGQNSVCTDSTTRNGYNCKCKDGYDGNPYLSEGCQEIKDPVKLSSKLTRALHRKLQHSPNTWVAFTTSRVGSARFPERYQASFPDSVTVAGLEVSEGDSIFEVSSGASTSSKTQSQKMPIQPSFRSRGKSTKAASSSRGSDKNQGGSFLDSVKEVLDEGGSAPAKGVGSSEPKVQEVGLPSEVPMTEADPQVMRDPPESEPPRNKRSRTDQVDRPSRSSSSSSRGGTVGWNFSHSKPGSVLDDPWGLATLMRHMKSPGCALPSISNLTHKDEYVDIAHHMGQLAGAINRAQFKFEDVVHNAPSAEELAQVTELVKANKTELNQTRALISDLQAEVQRLGSKCDAQQGTIESQLIDLQVKNRKIGELDAARKIAEYQVKELISTSQNSQKNKEAEVRLAVRRGKKEVAEAYNKILVIVKEKFSKKKDEVDLLVHAQEIQANTELLKDILDGEIKSTQDEYDNLVALMPEAVAAYEKAQVSDFSIGKLPLPQLSESSAPVETASGGNDKEMEEVPEEEDPASKGAEKSSDDKEV